MGTFFSIILDILAILAIIIFGAFIIVVVADLILCMFDDHEGIIFRKNKKSSNTEKIIEETKTVKQDDIVVYTNQANPNGTLEKPQAKKTETVEGEVVSAIDFNKAVEEQQALNRKRGVVEQPIFEELKPTPAPAKKEVKQNDDDMFWDANEDKEFKKILDECVKEAKNIDKKQKEVVVEPKKEEVKVEEPKEEKPDETKQALEELKALKEQQQKELEEFKQLKEDFAREKEEQLALLKENLDKAKADEIERIRQEAILEQEKNEAEKARLEEEKAKLEEERQQLKEEQANKSEEVQEPIIKETIIKDEEEINKLKMKNLMRMDTRLSKIIKDTERLKVQKEKEQERLAQERQKLLEKEQEEKLKEQAKRIEIQKQNQERLLRQSEALRQRNEINRKLNDMSNRVGKYKLNSAIAKIAVEHPGESQPQVIEEIVTTVEETIPGTDIVVKTIEKEPMQAPAKPTFEKEYYEQKLVELDAELKEAEKELRINKQEYIPLTRIHKAYARDSEKLRKKELQIAKQKVALYGVNSTKIDPNKKSKLDENLATYAELKDSVSHCEEVIKKNKDRYPVIEKNHKLITKQIDRINEDIKTCEKAISYYNKKK